MPQTDNTNLIILAILAAPVLGVITAFFTARAMIKSNSGANTEPPSTAAEKYEALLTKSIDDAQLAETRHETERNELIAKHEDERKQWQVMLQKTEEKYRDIISEMEIRYQEFIKGKPIEILIQANSGFEFRVNKVSVQDVVQE